jgi:hypothetical protein
MSNTSYELRARLAAQCRWRDPGSREAQAIRAALKVLRARSCVRYAQWHLDQAEASAAQFSETESWMR